MLRRPLLLSEILGMMFRLPVMMTADGLAFELVHRCLLKKGALEIWGWSGLLLFWSISFFCSVVSLGSLFSSKGFDVYEYRLKSTVYALFLFYVAAGWFGFLSSPEIFHHAGILAGLLLAVPVFRKISAMICGCFSWSRLPLAVEGSPFVRGLWQEYLLYDSSAPCRVSGNLADGRPLPLLRLVCVDSLMPAADKKAAVQMTAEEPFCLFTDNHSEKIRLPGKRSVYCIFKRLLDVILAGAGLLLLMPMFLVIVFIIRFTGKGPVFYGSTRIGKNGAEIVVWKFRTMSEEFSEGSHKLGRLHQEEWKKYCKVRNDQRICSAFCLWLRRTSLDELPQLWNVLKGDMSLVGPRPVVPGEISRYGENKQLLVSVRPGMTGLWQVSGRNHIPYDHRIWWDMYYIRHTSFWLDWEICLRTVREVFSAHGM